MLVNKRTFVLMISVVALLLILAGCQQPAAPAASASDAPTPTAVTEPVATAPAAEPTPEAMPEADVNIPAEGMKRDYRLVVVAHGGAQSDFWSVVMRGVEQGAKDMGVVVEYKAPDTFDMGQMVQLLDEAIASDPDGLIVSIPDANALGPSIRRAVEAGIPVFSINSGSDVAEKMGVIAHVGQIEYQAGYGAGKHMAEAGITKAICINHEVGNVALDLRCQGFADALAEDFIESTVVEVLIDDTDFSASEDNILSAVEEALSVEPEIDGVLILGVSATKPALTTFRAAGLMDKLTLANFDLSPEILQAIQAGEILFAVDQQPYMQGYLPVVYMTLYLDNLNVPGGQVVLTGPGYVTHENVDEVIQLSEQGTR